MNLSLRRMRTLHEFARRGTVTSAAEALHYTPSAVSQQLNALERDIGLPLFEQVGRRLRLTPSGRMLAQHASEMVAAEERARADVERAQTSLTADLTVGVMATFAASLLPTTLRLLEQCEPGISVSTREVSPEVALQAVHDGDFDMTFVLDYPQTPVSLDLGLRSTTVAVEQLYVVTTDEHHPPSGPVALTDFADREWIASGASTDFGRAFLATCRDAGFEPRVRHEIDSQSTALSMAAAGLGVTLIADLGLTPLPEHARILPLRTPPLRRLLLVGRSSTIYRPSEAAFVRATLDAATETAIHPDLVSVQG